LETRKVITSFVMHGGRVLLLHRSDKVGSMRGKWAGVSGYVEGEEDPLKRALKEIAEEVGLRRDQIRLVRSGSPIEVPDPDADRLWVVHPFLFEAETDRVRLDWEHDEYRWIAPAELDSYETVPHLREAFRSVNPTP